jgi:MFS family permease
VLGGIAGGPIEQFLGWRWNFWCQLILGVGTQILRLAIAKESRATVLLDREAKKQREMGYPTVWRPNEKKTFRERFHPKELCKTTARPFIMLVTEPIVLCLSLLSGFADALIFSFFLIALAISYVIGYLTFFPVVMRHNTLRSRGEQIAPEARLKPLLFHVVLLPMGLLICAFVATGPPLHWAGVFVASILVGIASFAIYYATIDYMVAAYGPYSASACGGNGFMRDFLAGMCALYTGPMYKNLGIRNAYLVLFGLAVLFCGPVYVFYFKGSEIRARSKFARKLADAEESSGVELDELDGRGGIERRVHQVIPPKAHGV